MPQPSLLFLSPRVPFPLDSGAKIRTDALLRALLKVYAVDYRGFLQPELSKAAAREALRDCHSVSLISEPAVTRPGRVWLACEPFLIRVLSQWSNIGIRNRRDKTRAWQAAHPDGIIHADHVHMGAYLGIGTSRLRVMDEHNVEAIILERLAEHFPKSPAAHFFRLQARRMRATESALARQADLVLAVSERDAEQLRALAPGRRVEVIPNGVDLDFYISPRAGTLLGRRPGRIVFTGSMNWIPNEDGVLWFMKEIWPLLPDGNWSLDVVGHAPGKPIRALACNQVRVTGTVEDTRPYIDEADVFVVPLRIGGGSRLKILEAFAMGIAVVSTKVGCEGLGVEHNKQLLIADTPQDFAKAIIRVRREAELAKRLTAAATRHVREHFSRETIGEKLIGLYQEYQQNMDR